MKIALTTLTLAAVVAAGLSTASFAQQGGHGGADRQPPFNFSEMDANSDGKVTKEEIAAHRTAMIAAIDANGDGNITADELMAMREQQAEQRATDRAAKMIERLDADKDGKLSVAEMTAGADHGGRGDKMFDRVDTDKDGAISQEEADVAKAKMEERMKDRDGKRGHMKDGRRGGDN
jgi:hypothetical protein